MNLNEFANFRKNCLACDHKNVMTMSGTLKEEIGDSQVHCIFNYLLPIFRKDFLTFGVANAAVFAPDDFLDVDTLNKEKYNTLVINKDGYVSFDKDFLFRIKFNFRVFCPHGHYAYESRSIRISNKSPDITKGYPIASETLSHEKYRVISNNIEKTTTIYNFNASRKPIVIPHMDIMSFPYDDPEKFTNKVQNILLLA